MKILFIVPYVPNRIRTRPYHLIRFLTKLGHSVSVYTLWSDESERRDADHLAGECHEIHAFKLSQIRSMANSLAALPTRLPLQSVYCWQPALIANLERNIKSAADQPFDIIHVEHLRGARYGVLLKKRFPGLPVVWDSVDCISYLFSQAAGRSRSLFGRIVTRLELNRTREYERWLQAKFDQILITSPVDRQALLDLRMGEPVKTPITVLPNGVDCDYFRQGGEVTREPASLVFSGKMSYHANITMVHYLVEKIMPLVWTQKPDVRLTVVGKDPPGSILSLGKDPRIQITGTVDDIRPYLKKAAAAVVPQLYGAGLQNKVLEAMACGTPVVATPNAVSALTSRPENIILLASEPASFADCILGLVNDAELRSEIGNAGLDYVEKKHHWEVISQKLVDVYESVVKSIGER